MTPIRKAAFERLDGVKGIFLRCDRGNSLYVTNALMRSEEVIDWAAAGFDARIEGKLSFLVPQEIWVERLEGWLKSRTKGRRLADAVANACFGMTEKEDFDLWIEGIKRLELKGDAGEYEKLVRQRAAVCLREKRGGGTIVSCALMADWMREGGNADEA